MMYFDHMHSFLFLPLLPHRSTSTFLCPPSLWSLFFFFLFSGDLQTELSDTMFSLTWLLVTNLGFTSFQINATCQRLHLYMKKLRPLPYISEMWSFYCHCFSSLEYFYKILTQKTYMVQWAAVSTQSFATKAPAQMPFLPSLSRAM